MAQRAIAFDTLAYAKRLKAVGFTEAQAETQAETLADLVNNEIVTKQYFDMRLQELDRRLQELEMRLKHELTIRLGAMMAASIAIVAALVKLL